MSVDITKYLGKWYQLAHYPSWFQHSDCYNTTAEYKMIDNYTILVVNTNMCNGELHQVKGQGKILGDSMLRVSFPSVPTVEGEDRTTPNYIIDNVWINNNTGEYQFATVTNCDKSQFYLLSREPHPCLEEYNQIINYVTNNFNRDKIVLTPHY
jgi:apolipoprotein D and lipocalin family protein